MGEKAPKTLDEFQKFKYTDAERFEVLSRERKTISAIESKNWEDEFKQKAKDVYYQFRADGIEMGDHALARYLSRQTDRKGNVIFTYDSFKEICQREPNYVQDDGRPVRYYDGIAVVANPRTKEIVSVIVRKHPKSEWRSVDDSAGS